MDWVTVLTKVVFPLLGAIITYVLLPYIRSKATAEQLGIVSYWAEVAVHAAEMIYKEKGQGVLKKEYVLDFLKQKGFKITEAELDAIIEAAVKELNILDSWHEEGRLLP